MVQLFIRNYKTSRTNGELKITLDDSLSIDIRSLVNDGRKYLFHDKSGLPLSSSAFTHRLERIFFKEFKVNLSTSLIRKILATGNCKEHLSQMKNEATQMGHSLDTHLKIYVSNVHTK